MRLRALTLSPPWHHALLHFDKRVENRTAWKNCSYRGWLLLHAGKQDWLGSLTENGPAARRRGFDRATKIMLENWKASHVDFGEPLPSDEELVAKFARPVGSFGELNPEHVSRWVPNPEDPRGAVIGVTYLDGTISNESEFAAYAATIQDPEAQRRWWFGGFALILKHTFPLPPFPVRGGQGFFFVDHPGLEELDPQSPQLMFNGLRLCTSCKAPPGKCECADGHHRGDD